MATPGLFGSFIEGYQVPHKMRAEKEKAAQIAQARADAHKAALDAHRAQEMISPYLGEQKQLSLENVRSQMALREQQRKGLEQKLAHPELSRRPGAGIVGQVEELFALKKRYGADSPIAVAAEKALQVESERKAQLTTTRKGVQRVRGFMAMPSDWRGDWLAYNRGMGVGQSEAIERWGKKQKLKDIAAEKGLSWEEIKRSYPSSKKLRVESMRRGAYLAEIESFSKNMRAPLVKYGRKLFGWAPKQISEAISGESPEEQGKILAAVSLQKELANVRNLAMAGKAGVEAMREMEEAAFAKTKIFETLISPEARGYMMDYTDKWIKEAQQAFNKHITQKGRFTGKPTLRKPMKKRLLPNYTDAQIRAALQKGA